MQLYYPDTATFVKVSSGGYSNNKVVVSQDCVPVIFLQNTGYTRSNNQDGVDSDAVCFPDPFDPFVTDNHYRLEGMYILAPFFDASDEEGWYKVTRVTVNRDHLLNNQVRNVEILLKKTSRIPGVS